MKTRLSIKVIALLCMLPICLQMFAQKRSSGAVIAFNNRSYSYGTVKQNSSGKHDFIVTNKGNEPLVIADVKSSCGCVVASWSQQPILPGQKGTISVKYNTAKVGEFRKTIVAYTNAQNESKSILHIEGNVAKHHTH